MIDSEDEKNHCCKEALGQRSIGQLQIIEVKNEMKEMLTVAAMQDLSKAARIIALDVMALIWLKYEGKRLNSICFNNII